MSEPIGRRYLNSAIFPNQLVQAYATTWNGVPSAQFVLPGQWGLSKYLSRIILTTTLTASDMVGGDGGAYWNTSAVPAIQAPFYLFFGSPAQGNIIDLSLIGAINVGENINPMKVPPNTDLVGLWTGVIADSATKCEAICCFVDVAGA